MAGDGHGRPASYERRFDPAMNLEQLLDIYRFAMEHPAHGPSSAESTPQGSELG